MSLVTRLIGVALCLSGGLLMGYAQGVEIIGTAAGNIVIDVGTNMQTVGAIIAHYIGALVVQKETPNYGTYWVFGIALAIGGFILIARGDRKPRSALERAPLLSEPLSVKQQE